MKEADEAPTDRLSRPFRVVFAPDSFKGSLTSVEVARALADGWSRARPGDEIVLAPLADGGEGTLVAIEAAGGWEWREAEAHDPLGRPIRSRWLRSIDGERAVLELAAASGLSRVQARDRDPIRASTRGTGEVVRAALDEGITKIVLGVGGSATTDGGSGILVALGARLLDADGHDLEPGGGALANIDRVGLTDLDERLPKVELRIACDVTNPLLGPMGAAATYGPQKGASVEDVAALDAALARFADRLEAAVGRTERETPGAGAAGGTTFGLACLSDRLRSFALVPGVELVMAEIDLDGKLDHADLVITGEGRIDAQTAFGKTALGVARRAAEHGVQTIAVGGGVDSEGIEALCGLGVVAVPVIERPMSVEEAMAAGTAPVVRCGERIARLIGLGESLASFRTQPSLSPVPTQLTFVD